MFLEAIKALLDGSNATRLQMNTYRKQQYLLSSTGDAFFRYIIVYCIENGLLEQQYQQQQKGNRFSSQAPAPSYEFSNIKSKDDLIQLLEGSSNDIFIVARLARDLVCAISMLLAEDPFIYYPRSYVADVEVEPSHAVGAGSQKHYVFGIKPVFTKAGENATSKFDKEDRLSLSTTKRYEEIRRIELEEMNRLRNAGVESFGGSLRLRMKIPANYKNSSSVSASASSSSSSSASSAITSSSLPNFRFWEFVAVEPADTIEPSPNIQLLASYLLTYYVPHLAQADSPRIASHQLKVAADKAIYANIFRSGQSPYQANLGESIVSQLTWPISCLEKLFHRIYIKSGNVLRCLSADEGQELENFKFQTSVRIAEKAHMERTAESLGPLFEMHDEIDAYLGLGERTTVNEKANLECPGNYFQFTRDSSTTFRSKKQANSVDLIQELLGKGKQLHLLVSEESGSSGSAPVIFNADGIRGGLTEINEILRPNDMIKSRMKQSIVEVCANKEPKGYAKKHVGIVSAKARRKKGEGGTHAKTASK